MLFCPTFCNLYSIALTPYQQSHKHLHSRLHDLIQELQTCSVNLCLNLAISQKSLFVPDTLNSLYLFYIFSLSHLLNLHHQQLHLFALFQHSVFLFLFLSIFFVHILLDVPKKARNLLDTYIYRILHL